MPDYSVLNDEDLKAAHAGRWDLISDAGLKALHNTTQPGYNPNKVADNIQKDLANEGKIGHEMSKMVPEGIKDLIGKASSSIMGHVEGGTMGAVRSPDALVPNQGMREMGAVMGSPVTIATLMGANAAPEVAGKALDFIPGGKMISKLAGLFKRGSEASEAVEQAAPAAKRVFDPFTKQYR